MGNFMDNVEKHKNLWGMMISVAKAFDRYVRLDSIVDPTSVVIDSKVGSFAIAIDIDDDGQFTLYSLHSTPGRFNPHDGGTGPETDAVEFDSTPDVFEAVEKAMKRLLEMELAEIMAGQRQERDKDGKLHPDPETEEG